MYTLHSARQYNAADAGFQKIGIVAPAKGGTQFTGKSK